jgi:hypothetical protein
LYIDAVLAAERVFAERAGAFRLGIDAPLYIDIEYYMRK